MENQTSASPAIGTGLACFAIMGISSKSRFRSTKSSINTIGRIRILKNMNCCSWQRIFFKARFVETTWGRLNKTNLPAIAQSKDKGLILFWANAMKKSPDSGSGSW